MTPAFIEQIARLVEQNYKKRFGHYKILDYDFIGEIKEYAMRLATKHWDSLNLEKSTNAYAFFTQRIVGAFVSFQAKRRKQIALDSVV